MCLRVHGMNFRSSVADLTTPVGKVLKTDDISTCEKLELASCKVFSWRNLRDRNGRSVTYIWQRHYIVINIAGHCFGAKSLFYFKIFSRVYSGGLENSGESGLPDKMHLPWRNTFAIAFQQWPGDYSQFTLDFSRMYFFILFWKWTRFGALVHIATTPALSAQRVRRMNGSISWHISIQFQG